MHAQDPYDHLRESADGSAPESERGKLADHLVALHRANPQLVTSALELGALRSAHWTSHTRGFHAGTDERIGHSHDDAADPASELPLEAPEPLREVSL